MSIIHEVKGLLTPSYDVRYNPDLLLEINKKVLLRNTDKDRKWRSRYQVRTRPLLATIIDEPAKIWMLEYNFKSFPSTENKRQYGYILYNENKKDVEEVYCTCKDFFYRLWAPYVRKHLADWNTDRKYKRQTKAPIHNRQWTVKTNPTGKLYCCKHLAAALAGYVED